VVLSAALLGAFTSGLGVQMVNSAISDIGGAVRATPDEASWISTAYSVGEIAMIPLAGMLTQVLGLRRFMVALCLLFMATALASAVLVSLQAEIALRAAQGMLAGGFGVVAFGTIFRVFPVKGRAFGLMLLTLVQTVPSNLGAVLAGWLTAGVGWEAV
jgi:DHA2 family multidrug resistance protein